VSSRADASIVLGSCAVFFAGCLVTIDRGRIEEEGPVDVRPDRDAMTDEEIDAGDASDEADHDAAEFQLAWPVGGWVASDERHPNGLDHSGTADIAVPYWTPVGAARSGTVVTASYDDGNGFFVTLDHGFGYRTLYAHLSAPALVEGGQTVTAGQPIGYSGRTGLAIEKDIDNGAHLHFAIVKDGTRVAVPSLELGSWVTRGARISGSFAPLPLLGDRADAAFDVKVAVPSAPLVDAPAATASAIGSVTSGDVLRVVDSHDGYYRVEGDGGAAWVVHSATMPTGSELSLVTVTVTVTVTVDANVRSGPSTSNGIIGAVTTGSLVTILGRSGAWGRLLIGQPAVYGWMHLDNTTPTSRFRTHVRSKTLSVYGGPGFQHPVSGTRAMLDPLLVEETREGWYRIDVGGHLLPNGTRQPDGRHAAAA
jgi:hypothetical protein